MKQTPLFLLTLLSTTAGQLLSNGIGQLPSCGQSCDAFTQVQSSCGDSWNCFCSTVYENSGGNLNTVCAASCTNPSDSTAVVQWYTANCGSDNGAKEHPNNGGQQTSTNTASAPTSSTTATGVESSSGSDSACGGSWWNCHWKWIVMIIVIAIGLIALGFGGRWLKRRHDRKRDQNRHAFNAGITSRSAHITDDKAAESSSSSSENTTPFPGGANGSSPARTRDAFMPYGYGYARSGSRNGQTEHESFVTRGGTPFEEMEKGPSPWKNAPNDESGVRGKMRRVLVRERSLGSQ